VGPSVLIVDDHASFRRLAARMLQQAGFVVVGEAQDAAGALAAVARLRPDMVLLDVVLPDGSGIDVARELARGAVAPRVVLTSSRVRSDFGSGFEWPPGSEFLPKHELGAQRLLALIGDR
jgi:DNA-binding NarL/FixJ family response regulator